MDFYVERFMPVDKQFIFDISLGIFFTGEKSGEMIIIYIKIISFYRTLLNIVL